MIAGILSDYDLGVLTKHEVFALVRDAVKSRGWVEDFDLCVREAAQGHPWMCSGVWVYPNKDNIAGALLWLDESPDVSF